MDAEHTPTHDPAPNPADHGRTPGTATRRAATAASHGQLHLHIGAGADQPDWRLDEETRAVGRRGIAQARAALRSARADHLARDADDRAAHGTATPSRRPTAA